MLAEGVKQGRTAVRPYKRYYPICAYGFDP